MVSKSIFQMRKRNPSPIPSSALSSTAKWHSKKFVYYSGFINIFLFNQFCIWCRWVIRYLWSYVWTSQTRLELPLVNKCCTSSSGQSTGLPIETVWHWLFQLSIEYAGPWVEFFEVQKAQSCEDGLGYYCWDKSSESENEAAVWVWCEKLVVVCININRDAKGHVTSQSQ